MCLSKLLFSLSHFFRAFSVLKTQHKAGAGGGGFFFAFFPTKHEIRMIFSFPFLQCTGAASSCIQGESRGEDQPFVQERKERPLRKHSPPWKEKIKCDNKDKRSFFKVFFTHM